jgi:hypothetical protein
VPIRDIRVLDNDTDLNGQALTVTAATAAGGGTVVINADGTLTYTPSAATNASGSDTITYTVTDGTTSVQAQVVVTLVPPPSRATTGEILGPAVQDFQWTALSSGTAAGFYQGTIGYGPQAVSGQFLVISNGDLASVLDSSRAGTDNHTRTGAGGYDVTTLQLTIAVPAGANFVSLDFAFLSNEFPLFTSGQGGVGDFNDAFLVEIGGSTFEVDPVTGAITAPNNVAYDAKDPGRTPLTVNSAFFGATRVQTLTGTALNGGTPLLRVGRVLQPGDVINGQVKVYVTVLDAGDGEIDSAAFLRSVQTGVVDPSLVHDGITQVPLAADDWAALHKGQPVTIPVLANDVDFDGNPLQIVGASGAQHGKLTINPNGTITYVAEAGYKGDDAFTYVVRNPAGQVSTATVRLYGLVTSTSSTSLLPTASGQVGTTLALVSLANGAVGNGATPVTVSDYAGNPVGGTQTGVFFDIQGLNATTSHRAVVEVDAPNGGTLVFWDGTGWQPVRSSGNTDPIKLPNGKFLVVLDGTSFPRITALTGTVFSVGTDAGGGAGGGGGGGTPTVTASLASGSLSGFSSRLSDGGAGSGLSGFGQSNGFRGPAQVTLVVTAVQDSRATSDLASQSGSDEQRGLTDDERLAYLQFLVDTHPQDPFKLWMLGGDEALWLWFRQAQGKPPAVAPKKKDAGRDNTAIDPVAPPELVQVTGLLEEPMAAEAGPWVQPAEPPATVLPTEAPAPPTLVTPVERAAAPEATAPWAGLAGLLLAGLVQPALAQDENRRRRPARG